MQGKENFSKRRARFQDLISGLLLKHQEKLAFSDVLLF